MDDVRELLHGGPTTTVDLERLQGKLLFSLPPVRPIARFFILLILSTIIAAGGLIGNSSAVIIGAMIVAPLMTPMMAASVSIVTGDGRNIVRSVAIVLVGVVVVIAVGALMAGALPAGAEVTPEVKARTSPRILDLVVALAAGAAGAFALGREDVSDALPGVAIAVSLVPPLAAAGICLAAGEPSLAGGAFLLFLTNFVAIVGAGVVLLAIMGYPRVALRQESSSARRRSIAVIVVSLVLVAIPLGIQSYRVASDEILRGQAATAIDTWLAGTDYKTIGLQAENDTVTAAIQGQGTIPPMAALLADLQAETDQRGGRHGHGVPDDDACRVHPTLSRGPSRRRRPSCRVSSTSRGPCRGRSARSGAGALPSGWPRRVPCRPMASREEESHVRRLRHRARDVGVHDPHEHDQPRQLPRGRDDRRHRQGHDRTDRAVVPDAAAPPGTPSLTIA